MNGELRALSPHSPTSQWRRTLRDHRDSVPMVDGLANGSVARGRSRLRCRVARWVTFAPHRQTAGALDPI